MEFIVIAPGYRRMRRLNYIQSSWDSFLSSFCIKHLTFTISSARLRSIIVSNHCQVKTISSFKFYQYSKLKPLCKSSYSSLQHTEWVRNLLSTLMSVCTDLFACDFISIAWAYSHIPTLIYMYVCRLMCNKKQYRPVLKQMQKLWWFSMAVMLVTNDTTWIVRWHFIWTGGQKRRFDWTSQTYPAYTGLVMDWYIGKPLHSD